MKSILHINSSARSGDSLTRQVTSALVSELNKNNNHEVIERNVAQGVSFIDEQWVTATFTDAERRTDQQKQVLAYSDVLVDELKKAKYLVIGAPMYNFSIPATLKAWIDMIARAGVTFKYTEQGPVGLLSDKKAYVVLASGGVEIGSALDFSSSYLKQVLAFIGLTDVTIINAAEQGILAKEQLIEVVS